MSHLPGLSLIESLHGQGLSLLQMISLATSLEVGLYILLHYWLFGTIDKLHTSNDLLLVSAEQDQFLLHAAWTSHLHGRPTTLPPVPHYVAPWKE